MQEKLKEVLKNIQDPITNAPLDSRLEMSQFQSEEAGCLSFFIGDIPVQKRDHFDQFVKSVLKKQFPKAAIDVSYTLKSTLKPTAVNSEKLKETFDASKINKKSTLSSQSVEPPKPPPASAPKVSQAKPIPGIKKIIAVASGKGGVGKSTVSALLACAFSELGFKTALLDGDVYGPSQVQLFGCKEPPKAQEGVSGSNPKILPVDAGNISLMSFSFFLDVNEPVIWRGPMIMSVLRQFFFDVVWGEQDIMIIDLPPGTGDAPLSMVQCVPVDGSVIVTTPQAISVLDAIKGGQMFRKLNTPILGVVENMSTFECDSCHKEHHIFRQGGGEIVSKQLEAPILAQIPLQPKVCSLMDQGYTWQAFRTPSVLAIAKQLAIKIGNQIGLDMPQEDLESHLPPKKRTGFGGIVSTLLGRA